MPVFSRQRRLLSAATLICALTQATSAVAKNERAVAEALFQEGKGALEHKDYDVACAKLEQSMRLDPAPGTLFFWAECEEGRGHTATAWGLFKELEQKLPLDDPRRPTVVARARSLEPRVPRLSVHLDPSAPEGATVFRDGSAMTSASLGTPLPLDPGSHEIVVKADGRLPNRVTVDLAAGDRVREITVEAGEAIGGMGPQALAGITVAGVGLAAVAAGIAVGAAANTNYGASAPHCDGNDFCSPEGVAIRDSALGMATAGTVVFFIGAAAAATGTVVWLTAPEAEGGLASAGPIRVGLGLRGLVIRGNY